MVPKLKRIVHVPDEEQKTDKHYTDDCSPRVPPVSIFVYVPAIRESNEFLDVYSCPETSNPDLTTYLCDESLPFITRNMRETSDLVNEMLTEAKKTFLVAIAVGFTTETKFVFSSAKSPLKDLNTLIQRGGAPIGLLRFEKDKSIIQGSYRPFIEYETEEWVGKYLAGLLENTQDIMILSQRPDVMEY